MTEYLIESTLCLAVFHFVFVVFFKKSRNYQINRIVLLFSILFSLLVPVLRISPITLPIQKIEQNEHLLNVLSVPNYLPDTASVDVIAQNSSLDLSFILTVIYSLVTLVLFGRFAFHLGILFLKGRDSDKVTHHGHKLTLIDEKVNPFTFFNSIFVCRADYQNEVLEEELLLHEIAHKNQWHSMDVVIIELVQVFFWFNPFIYLFKQLIKANHEYLADEFVLQSGASCKDYSNKLLRHTFPHKMSGFVSGFNRAAGRHVLIKQRLIMVSQFQQKKPLAYRFLLLVPVVSMLFVTTAFKSSVIPESVLSQVENGLYNPGTLYATTIVWSSQDNRVYLHGENVRVKHGDNDFTVNGRASYLGQVYYFVFNNQPVTQDSSIEVAGKKCQVVKLSKEEATKKYGEKGRQGALEISVIE